MHWSAPLQQWLLQLFIKPSIIGEPALATGPHTYFVLEHKRSSLPLVLRTLLPTLDESKLLFADSSGEQPLREDLYSLIKAQRSNPDIEIQLIPVSVFYGHLPKRERSLVRALFGESWTHGNPITRALRIILNGRKTLVSVDKPVLLDSLDDLSTDEASRKLTRILRTHFQITRRAVLGPDLSHRRTLLKQIMQHKNVQSTLDQHCEQKGINRFRAEQESQRILDSIAADFSPNVARMLNAVVSIIAKRLYPGGIQLHNTEQLRHLSQTHQLIYLPCHRSHMDYVTLSWALHQKGLMLPHVAAGDNLNFPVIGPILRRGGAIFMRRSFKGDQLYYTLYKTYLETMSHHGHALEYFIEGGRSRTGRLLHARTGLLRMTIESYQATPNIPLAIIPVWIGYDRLMEGQGYQAELAGRPKQTESLSSSLSALSLLGKRYGSTHLNIGEPILLADHVRIDQPAADQAATLGQMTLRQINRSASLLPISLLATCLLATPSRRMDKKQLIEQCHTLIQLLSQLPDLTLRLPDKTPAQWLEQAQRYQQISIAEDHVFISEEQAQSLTFYRNTILHLLALPGLYLLMVRRLEGSRSQLISRLLSQLYPVLDAELTLPWHRDNLTKTLRSVRDILHDNALLINQQQHWHAPESSIGQMLQMTAEPILLRYYLVLRIVDRYQQISQDDLISQSARLATMIHRTYGFQSREYADKRVLKSFIEQALAHDLIGSTEGRIRLNQDPSPLFKLARKVLRPHLIISIDQKLGSAG